MNNLCANSSHLPLLLIEDEPSVMAYVRAALERSGYPASAQVAYQAALAADSTYAKASLGLERVAGRGEDSTAAEIDLTTLARDFQASVEQWRDEFACAGTDDQDQAAADSTTTRGMARDSTPDVVSRPDSSH